MKEKLTFPKKKKKKREGKWMPPNMDPSINWLHKVVKHATKSSKNLHPVLQEFKQLIDTNARVYMLMTSMFQQIPYKPLYSADPSGQPIIRSPDHLLQVLNHLIETAPSYNDTPGKFGLIGLPVNTVFDYAMGTAAGYAAFLDPDINAAITKMLNVWGDFLRSPASTKVLHTDTGGISSSWFGEPAITELTTVANVGGGGHLCFDDLYICDPKDPLHGFKSWDDFFTRQFRDGVRPIAAPNDDSVIANACESQPYRISRDVKARENFWVKGQPYSVLDMLDYDDFAADFIGGTIYQAFLSALSYHRWHSPVTGHIVKAYVVPGTHYSEPLFEGLADPSGYHDVDFASEISCQGYLTATATRALIFIQADNPAIGLLAFIGVGMAEVSTCDITVKQGQRINKGDEIGMFHFGGSTHCILFRKGVNVHDFPKPGEKDENHPVRSQLAIVSG